MNSLNLYDFDLPKELIATTPSKQRGASRLLCLLNDEEAPRHDEFHNIRHYLKPGDVLVVNNTKVMKARLEAFKSTGGKAEILLVRPLPNGNFEALINGNGPFLAGSCLYLGSPQGPKISIVGKHTTDAQGYELSCDVDLTEYAQNHGEMPLPPYFRRRAVAEDNIRYQTVFAKELGAVASPTAGLHFTDQHLSELIASGIKVVEITLHVGPGTFLPIRCDNILDHTMHREYFRIEEPCAHTLNQARQNGNRIIAVGSTAMRVLEQVMQWSLERNSNQFFASEGATAIFIRPGHQILGCDAVITNFHVPRSTLIVLVAAVAGRERILRAYQEAIEQKYRFFSYGDACFIEVRKSQ
jgi:S-adenosylmethionine:tRNA ribosyltransferase-isomerase